MFTAAAVAVVSIRVSRYKEIYCEQIGRLGSLECVTRPTTVFEVSKSRQN